MNEFSKNIVLKLIPFNEEYEFAFIEHPEFLIPHPASNYFLKLNDTSVNLLISLKWVYWGFTFLDSLSKNLNDLEDYNSDLLENIIDLSITKINNCEEGGKILLIDDHEILNKTDLDLRLNSFYLNSFFSENSKIHLKLKINLREFLIISHLMYPTFFKVEYRIESK